MAQGVRGLFREEAFLLKRGRVSAILIPGSNESRLEPFKRRLVAVRPMRDFAQVRRCFALHRSPKQQAKLEAVHALVIQGGEG